MLISPLARKLCREQGISPESLRGSGPRGRIMAADVIARRTTPPLRQATAMNDFSMPPTRPPKEGYFVYDASVDMAALAAISLPIAVQCEKVLENRYSLFDYIVRAVVKACTSYPAWMDASGKVDVLLFEKSGEDAVCIPDAAGKSIFRLARETTAPSLLRPAEFSPHIIICDAKTERAQVAAHLHGDRRPAFAFVVRGGAPKVGIRAGNETLHDFLLDYTFYASATLAPHEANRVAARLFKLLYDPASLMLLP